MVSDDYGGLRKSREDADARQSVKENREALGATDSGPTTEGRRIGPFGLGDAPAWLAVAVSLFGVIAALTFSGLQFMQSREQSRQTEKALQSNTSAIIFQEDREVWQRVTPDIYDYFHGADVPAGKENDTIKKARIVAGAMLDHFEHLRSEIASGAFYANRAAWGIYIINTFKNSPLLCQQFRENVAYYGGGRPGTIGEFADAAGCRA